MTTMRAARLYAFGRPLRVDEVDRPDPGPGEAVVRVAAAGISAGLRNTIAGRRRGSAFATHVREEHLPHVLGYQAAGYVSAVGPGAGRWREGDRVVVNGLLHCGLCGYCREGRDNLCPDARLLGFSIGVPGALAEYVRVPASALHALPPAVPFPQAPLVSDCGVGIHGLLQAGLRAGDTVALFGCGNLGLAILLAARGLGASRVVAVDPLPARRAMAERLGAETLDPSSGPAAERIRRGAGVGGVDVAVEAVGSADAILQAVDATRPGGAVVLVGIPEALTLGFSDYYRQVLAREVRLVPAFAKSSAAFARAITLLASGRMPGDGIPVETFPLDAVNAAVERALDATFGGRVVVTPAPSA